MGYVPEDAKWYLAEIAEAITVEGDPRTVVHTNMVLIRADSPDEAYNKSLALGKSRETSYENIEGRKVTLKFKGLHDLNVVYEELDDGAELIYSEHIASSEEEIGRWIPPKAELGVFAPISPSKGPDYAFRNVMQELYQRFPSLGSPDSTKES
jgi:uncharacterized protein DUF4288